MELKDILLIISNAGVPATILIIMVMKGFPLLTLLINNLKERNGELRDLISAIHELIQTLKINSRRGA